ncbi:MAG: FAD-binding protein [Methanobacteriota archaeon]|nr:MAG: FAD-binding protein [Euryarchaeota archaeon]
MPNGTSRRLVDAPTPELRVISSRGERMLYSRDQSEIPRLLGTFIFRSMPDAVVQPLSVDAVRSVVRRAAQEGLTIIPRGSASSPFGGSVPVAGGLVVDMSRMDRVTAIDAEAATATVEAGARWADVDNEASAHGLRVPTCPSSKFSTVGGWIATGGLGLNSYSRGHLSRSVLAVEIVSASGELRRFTPGDPEFKAVFGSEGQLGVIVSATLSLSKATEINTPHLLLFGRPEPALSFVQAVVKSDVDPVHIVFESSSKLKLVSESLRGGHLREGDGVIVSVEGEKSQAAFARLVSGLGLSEEKEYVARYLWNERFFPMKVRNHGPGMLGTELLVRQARLPEIIAAAERLCRHMNLEPMYEVHYLSDGDALLLCFYLVDQGNTFAYTLDAFKSLVLTCALIDAGGRPYSMGIWNHPFSEAVDGDERRRLGKVKAELDPKSLMNRGKYFSLSGRWAGLGGALLDPRMMRPLLRVLLAFSPVSTMFIGRVSRALERLFEPKSRDLVLAVADRCAMCGSCVSVCPAYLLTGDERVTARGKLLTAKAMAGGFQISEEHASRTFLCMRCKACEQVCQSRLELLPIYDEIERRLERTHGRDSLEIEEFLTFAENSRAYDELVRKGLVIGAPRSCPGGDDDRV